MAVLWTQAHLLEHPSDHMNRHLHRTVNLRLLSGALGLITLIAACGGGASDARLATISAITPDAALAFDRPATFSVKGTNLDIGLSASAAGCSNPLVLSGGTATSVQMRCTPERDGNISVNLHAPSGEVLRTALFAVPKPQLQMVTSVGSLLIELEPTKAPITVKNFLDYVQDGFFANTVFHRVYSSFVAQGGAFTFLDANYIAKAPTRPPIPLERTSFTGLTNLAGTIGMARASAPDSATTQFYINLADNVFLDAERSTDGNGYAVFGTVVSTADVNSESTLAAMKRVQVMSNGSETSLPVNPPAISVISRVR